MGGEDGKGMADVDDSGIFPGEIAEAVQECLLSGNYRRALTLSRELNDFWGITVSLKKLGDEADAAGDGQQAAGLYEEALERYREKGDALGCAACLVGLGGVAFSAGAFVKARIYYEDALDLCREGGGGPQEIDIVARLADAAYRMNDPKKAREYATACLAAYEERGEVESHGEMVLRVLGDIALQEGDLDTAQGHFTRGASAAEAGSLGAAHFAMRTGSVAVLEERYADAVADFRRAIEGFEVLGDREGVANGWKHLGTVAEREEDLAGAVTYYEKARAEYEAFGHDAGQDMCLMLLGDVADDMNDDAACAEHYTRLLALREQAGDPVPIAEAHFLLAQSTTGSERERHARSALDIATKAGQPHVVEQLYTIVGDALPPRKVRGLRGLFGGG